MAGMPPWLNKGPGKMAPGESPADAAKAQAIVNALKKKTPAKKKGPQPPPFAKR